MGPRRRLLLVGALLCCPACEKAAPAPVTQAGQGQARPALVQTGWVTDAAGVLSADAEQRLTARLSGFKQATQHQLVVVTVRSLDARSVDQFAHDLFNAWGVGRAKVNYGIMLLVAPAERRVRIQVGYGLERQLPNQRCAEIVQAMLPDFRRGDIAAGVETGTDAIIAEFERPQPSSSSSS